MSDTAVVAAVGFVATVGAALGSQWLSNRRERRLRLWDRRADLYLAVNRLGSELTRRAGEQFRLQPTVDELWQAIWDLTIFTFQGGIITAALHLATAAQILAVTAPDDPGLPAATDQLHGALAAFQEAVRDDLGSNTSRARIALRKVRNRLLARRSQEQTPTP